MFVVQYGCNLLILMSNGLLSYEGSGMNTFAMLEQLLQRKNQRFVCLGQGRDKTRSERFVARIEHKVAPPLSNEEIQNLREQLPELPQLIDLFTKYGSLRLFCNTAYSDGFAEHTCAFYIAHPDEWCGLNRSFKDWLEIIGEDDEDEQLPGWIKDYIVIGEIPNSGDYLLMPRKGPETGAVYEFDQDGFEFLKRGKSLIDFLTHVSNATDKLIQDINMHTRYFDNKTDMQWQASRYEYD